VPPLFEPGLERFVGTHPAFTPLRDDLARFLRLSRGEFFAVNRGAPGGV